MKTQSTFFSAPLVAVIRKTTEQETWAAAVKRHAVEAAAPWKAMTDDALWALMFGHTLPRSWMVWSNGNCPACRQEVPMYTWTMDALNRPWKTGCPHCHEWFPKNDFYAFYRSGLDEHGVFDPGQADRSLLFNAEHPDPKDPLHGYGVDDGHGAVDGDKRRRFIGAYLIYGQWRQAVQAGIQALAQAHVLTGDVVYARKAGILLDRVADLYPTFDYLTEAWTYEKQLATSAGYVTIWHDACEETREMALAYDQVFEALREDREWVAFLSRKAAEFRLPRPKASFADVQANIEDGLLRHPLSHREKIESNPPRTDIALLILEAVLSWHERPEPVLAGIGRMIATHTTVDGVTGEKGLDGYSAYVIQGLAQFLQTFEGLRPGLIKTLLREHPQLHQTWRFHIDTRCLQSYYPSCGDSGWFAGRAARYAGVVFRRPSTTGGLSLDPSLFTFLWNLYEATGDVAFVQTLVQANDDKLDNLPWDLREAQPEILRRNIASIIQGEGAMIRLPSLVKPRWHLAFLRSGHGRHERAVWLDYDSGNRHAHMDGMNLGLFAHGLDLMPDFGYPPVQFGGWDSPRSRWYMMTAAHNSVTVDGQNQKGTQWQPTSDSIAGTLTLWVDVPGLHAVRASGENLYEQTRQYERTVLLVDVSNKDFYVLEIFRVVGGTDHAKFIGSHFGTLQTQGLKLQPDRDYGHETQLRNFFTDPRPAPGWSADWAIEDRYGYRPPGTRLRFRYTDLTAQAQASVCEAWVIAGHFNVLDEAWVPRLMIRRSADTAPLASTFVGLIEAHENQPVIRQARRIPLVSANGEPLPDNHVALEIELGNGQTDLIMARDVENPLGRPAALPADELLRIPSWNACSDGSLVFLRRDAGGRLLKATVGEGRILRHEETALDAGEKKDILSIGLEAISTPA